MKKLFAVALAWALSLPMLANEGMWLPMLLGRTYEDMKENGLQLSEEELYSINEGSVKDAVVSFGGFCTGEIISPNGLILTNHHCGFDAVRSHSTPEDNLLDNGFWARSYSEEKPNEGLFVRFLVRMDDVTDRVLAELNDDMSEDERAAKIHEISEQIVAETTEDNHYDASVKSFFHGNEFYLFTYETFNDVRLVGAPPSSIGKFGGDTDNWMWPRHTGDFSMFRVYTAPDGSPAEYSEDNIPMAPKHFFPINISEKKEGDFTMVWGYPGSTDRYLSSYGVRQAIDKYNPTIVKIRDKKLEIMKKHMDADEQTRIDYASNYAQTSNYWKYYIGQTEQLQKNRVGAKKKAIEDQFKVWASSSDERKAKYGDVLKMLEEGYKATDENVVANVYVIQGGLLGSDLPLFAVRFNRLYQALATMNAQMEEQLKEADSEEKKEEIKEEYMEKREAIETRLRDYMDEHFGTYNHDLDRELFIEIFKMYAQEVPMDQQPAFFGVVRDSFSGDWQAYADSLYSTSILTSRERLENFLDNPVDSVLEQDMASEIGNEIYNMYRNSAASNAEAKDKLEKGYRLFTAGLREMNPKREYFPDANSTMRLTWGTIQSYYPRDGVFYDYYTTAQGILQKKDNDDPEFVVPEKLEQLIRDKDYGRYANEKGEMPVCFIHNTDITGGNSGSPVLNGKGELIGTAFDGNWEAMSGDIFFEDELQRTISVDSRYVLFIIDKYAGATNLIEEMEIVKDKESFWHRLFN